MKKIISLILACCLVACILPLTVFVVRTSAATSGYYTYEVENGSATITAVSTDISGDIIIPATLGDCPVTKIGSEAFEGCTLITSITIPDSVTSIGTYAFYDCWGLTSITIPDSVTTITTGTFGRCSSLTSVTLPDSLTCIWKSAFAECTSLKSILIPDSVTEIGNGAFSDCTSLESIDIPESVTSIGNGVFMDCTSLAKATIYSRNATFGATVFHNTAADFEIYGYTGSTAEAYATANSHTFVPLSDREATASGTLGTLTWELTTDGEMTITGEGALTDITANTPWSEYRDTVTTVTIGEGVSDMDNIAFAFCKNLTAINVDEANPNYTSIDGVLYSKDGKTMVCYPAGKADTAYTIPEGVVTIASYAFRTCENLVSVTIPDSVTTLGRYVFWGCENIESITIGKGVSEIGAWAFAYCDSLVNIEVDADNEYYKDVDGVLYSKDMNTLVCYPAGKTSTEFTVPESVTKIMNYAFSGCINLVSISLPASVKSVGNCVFNSCDRLTSISIAGSNTRYTSLNGILYNKDMTTLLYYPMGKTETKFTLPETVTAIGRYAFEDCDNLVTVNIGTNVTSVGYAAFAYCNKLTAINYAGTETEWNAIQKGSYWNRHLDGDEVKFGA